MTRVYLIFGEQGSGKTTQGERLAQKLGVPYFEAGQSLRDLSNTDTVEGNDLRTILSSGALAPNSYLGKVFDDFIKNNNTSNGFVTDGFPRTLEQVELLKELIGRHDWEIVGIYIIISDEVAIERLSKRTVLLGNKTVKRSDDNPEAVKRRLEGFRRETLPAINWIGSHYKLIKINGETSVNEVEEAITKEINGKI